MIMRTSARDHEDQCTRLLHLLFGVLWNETEHGHMTVRNCSGYTNFKVEAARTHHVTRLNGLIYTLLKILLTDDEY